MSTLPRAHRRLVFAAAAAALAGLMAGCSTTPSAMPGMDDGATSRAGSMAGHDAMSGMGDMPAGDGLAAASAGLTFAPTTTSLPAKRAASLGFRIIGADGKAVTAFEPDQTKLMHFYLIRSDLSGFQHVHPTMSTDGTWTAPLAAAQPGAYRAYASFITKDSSGRSVPLVLSEPVTVPGAASTVPLPPASTTTDVDGYTLTLTGDQLMAGMSHELTVTVSKDGAPVTDLQPYLDTYAHLTAFHDGDLAFAHLHPDDAVNGDHGGRELTFEAMLPKPGPWRLFLQFQTGGTLRTAAITVTVG